GRQAQEAVAAVGGRHGRLRTLELRARELHGDARQRRAALVRDLTLDRARDLGPDGGARESVKKHHEKRNESPETSHWSPSLFFSTTFVVTFRGATAGPVQNRCRNRNNPFRSRTCGTRDFHRETPPDPKAWSAPDKLDHERFSGSPPFPLLGA